MRFGPVLSERSLALVNEATRYAWTVANLDSSDPRIG